MPEQLAFTLLEVKEPWYYQKSRVNADKAITYEEHVESPEGIRQLERVFQIYDQEGDLTDREISDIYESAFEVRCNPSTISARRNDIINGKVEGYTVVPLIVDGKPLKRDGGQVNCLKRKIL